jgi:apolipoprotein N-acyltransferase
MVNFFLAVVSGLLIWFGFAPLELWIAPYLGIALLYRTLCEKPLPHRLILTMVTGLSFFLPLLHWSSVYVGAIPWLVLAIGESLIFTLIGIPRWIRRWESALFYALLFTLIELLRMKAPFGGFGWGRAGFTQIDSINWVFPIIGVTGVSLIVALAALIFTSARKFGAALMIAFLFGNATINLLMKDSRETDFQITAIQGGVDNLGLDFNKRALRVLDRHIQATARVPETDLYIWPENASDIDPLENPIANSKIVELINKIDAPLLIGAVETSDLGPKNSSLLFDAKGSLTSRYVKQDLAPFGEYMPLRHIAEAFSPYAEQVNDFLSGKEWIKHVANEVPFQSLICFEILDDDHAKDGARGSSFLIAQTNNATFGESFEAAQQLQITRARAAESGREFAVVSTTGLTAHINKQGKVLASLPQFLPGQITMKIDLIQPERATMAQRLESWMWVLALTLLTAVLRVRLSR